MSFSGADPEALADYAAQSIDAADSLRPIDARLATVDALLRRAVPDPPNVRWQVVGFARLGRRTRELGERVGTFGRRLRDALGGPSSKVPMTMDGLLFPQQAGSPPRPVGWDRWSAKDRGRYLAETDPALRSIETVNPWAIGRVAAAAGKGLVNGVVGQVDGVLNTATFGLAPDLDGPFTDDESRVASSIGRWSGTVATGIAAPALVAKAAPAVASRTAGGFAARRALDVAVGAASDGSINRQHTAGSMARAGLTGGALGGALDGVGQAYTSLRIARIDVPTISHGFDSIDEWQAFSRRLHEGLAARGYPEARAAVQGSGATGRSFHTGLPFDLGRTSDLDIAIASERLLDDVRELGVQMRGRGMRSAPVPELTQWTLQLRRLLKDLSIETHRPVRIMIYRSLSEAIEHKPSIPLPLKEK